MPSPSVARTLFLLSCQAQTGTLHVDVGGAQGGGTSTSRIVIDAGWVHALANLGSRRERGDEMLRPWLRQLPDDTKTRFEPSAAIGTWGRVTPFQPARVLREHFVEGADRQGAHLGRYSGRLVLKAAPHPSCLEADEITAVRLLDGVRTAGDLLATRVIAAERLARLLAFLDEAGVLGYDDAAQVAAWAALGLPSGTTDDEVRRAYHRLARTLHPDLHPDATVEERRSLEARLHALSVAYHRVLG